jgi:hypothetical protein
MRKLPPIRRLRTSSSKLVFVFAGVVSFIPHGIRRRDKLLVHVAVISDGIEFYVSFVYLI